MTSDQLIHNYERTWPRVKMYLPQAQLHVAHALTRPLQAADYERIRQKGLKGHLEHGGSINAFQPLDYLQNVMQEIDDALYYVAHWELKHGYVGLLYEAS